MHNISPKSVTFTFNLIQDLFGFLPLCFEVMCARAQRHLADFLERAEELLQITQPFTYLLWSYKQTPRSALDDFTHYFYFKQGSKLQVSVEPAIS